MGEVGKEKEKSRKKKGEQQATLSFRKAGGVHGPPLLGRVQGVSMGVSRGVSRGVSQAAPGGVSGAGFQRPPPLAHPGCTDLGKPSPWEWKAAPSASNTSFSSSTSSSG